MAPDSYIGFLALVQKDLYEDDLAGADKVLHEAIQAGHRDYRMLSLLGAVLLHEGAAPGEARFAEAKNALEKSAQENPTYSATQIALGKIYLMENQAQKAVEHLEIGRRLEPENPAVYASLASAYDQLGEHAQARLMRLQMGRLLAEKNPQAAPRQAAYGHSSRTVSGAPASIWPSPRFNAVGPPWCNLDLDNAYNFQYNMRLNGDMSAPLISGSSVNAVRFCSQGILYLRYRKPGIPRTEKTFHRFQEVVT